MDPPADERETSLGSESGWVPGRRRKGCSVLQHLPMVVGLVPVARGGLVVCGGARVVNGRGPQKSSPRNSHRDKRDHSRSPVLYFFSEHARGSLSASLVKHTQLSHCSQTPPAPTTTTTLRVSKIYISSHTGRGLGENHLTVRPSLAHGRTLPGRSRGLCSETQYSPRGSALE